MALASKMLAELIKLQTAEGMTHFGALYHAEKSGKLAVVLVHGLTGRFVGEVERSVPSLWADGHRRAFNGLCQAILQTTQAAGQVTVTALSAGLQPASVVLETA